MSFYFFSEEALAGGLAGGMQRNPELMQVNPDDCQKDWNGLTGMDLVGLHEAGFNLTVLDKVYIYRRSRRASRERRALWVFGFGLT